MSVKLSKRSINYLLTAGTGVCILATVWVVYSIGPTVYFLVFHRPFSLLQPAAAYHKLELPAVRLDPSISQKSLQVGGTQSISVRLQASGSIRGFLQVWVMSPDHLQTYRDPIDDTKPRIFQANTAYSFDFKYPVPLDATKGLYLVSTNLVSANKQIDYGVRRNFAKFEVL